MRWFRLSQRRSFSILWHGLRRSDIVIKGETPFTENYSVIGPEVLTGPMDEMLGTHDQRFIQQLQEFDRLIIAGQAKSHCVAWTVYDLLDDIMLADPQLAKKVYLLEDCTSACRCAWCGGSHRGCRRRLRLVCKSGNARCEIDR